jgi:hypothetical protein
LFRLGVVAKRLADMNEDVFITGREDEASAELKRIFAELVLFVSAGFGAGTIFHVVATEKMKDVGLFQLKLLVGFAVFVHQERKVDMALVPEESSVLKVTQTYGSERGAFPAKLVLMCAQLRDVFATENSTVVPQEHNHGRGGTPQRSQFYRMMVHVRQGDFRKPAAVGVCHEVPLSFAIAAVSRMNRCSFITCRVLDCLAFWPRPVK